MIGFSGITCIIILGIWHINKQQQQQQTRWGRNQLQ